jgi:hypothetical protein
MADSISGQCPDSVAVDAEVARIMRQEVPAGAVLRVARALRRSTFSAKPRALFTLEDVQRILRLNEAQFELVVENLPLIEIAGQVRVRPDALEQWLAERERSFRQERLTTWFEKSGVAG